MEESILLGASLKMEGQNQPTRVGEIVNTFADIANIVTPCEGMTVFVRDEQASYRVLSLKAKTISGVSVANAQVDIVEKCVDNKRITGTSPDSNALTDPFKFIGSYNSNTVQDLWNYLDGMCGTNDNAGKEGIFRARFGNSVIEVYSTPLLYKENQWLQVLKGRYKVSNGSLTQSSSYNILQRTHKDATGWSNWEIVAGVDLLTTMNTKINDVEKKVTDLIGEAPATLDTIHEIAAWILNDTTGAAAMMQQINELQNAINDIEIEAKENEVTLSLTDFKDGGNEVFIPAATEERAGVMSAADKQRLATVIEDNETQDEEIGKLSNRVKSLEENGTGGSGATEEQIEQIETNKQNIAELQSNKRDDVKLAYGASFVPKNVAVVSVAPSPNTSKCFPIALLKTPYKLYDGTLRKKERGEIRCVFSLFGHYPGAAQPVNQKFEVAFTNTYTGGVSKIGAVSYYWYGKSSYIPIIRIVEDADGYINIAIGTDNEYPPITFSANSYFVLEEVFFTYSTGRVFPDVRKDGWIFSTAEALDATYTTLFTKLYQDNLPQTYYSQSTPSSSGVATFCPSFHGYVNGASNIAIGMPKFLTDKTLNFVINFSINLAPLSTTANGKKADITISYYASSKKAYTMVTGFSGNEITNLSAGFNEDRLCLFVANQIPSTCSVLIPTVNVTFISGADVATAITDFKGHYEDFVLYKNIDIPETTDAAIYVLSSSQSDVTKIGERVTTLEKNGTGGSGATEEQIEQIDENTQAIEKLQDALNDVEVGLGANDVALSLKNFANKEREIIIPTATTTTAGVMGVEDKKMLGNLVEQEDDFYISDSNGNIIARIDKDGVHSLDFVAEGKSFLELFECIRIDRAQEELAIADSNGNVIARIDKDGVHTVDSDKGVYINSLYGKKLVTMGDSLFAGGQFGKKLSQLSGAIWDESLNNDHYSVGGTRTVSFSNTCGQGRAKTLVEDGLEPDIILYANTNDANIYDSLGSKNDESWFRHNVVKSDITPLSSNTDALNYFDSNFESVVGSVTPQVGTMLGIPYTVNNSIRLTILSAPKKEGDIKIKLNGNGMGTVYVHALATDTIEDIVNKIIEYDFNNYIDEKESTNSVLFSTSYNNAALTIDPVDTGVTYSIDTGVSSNLYVWKYFLGHDVNKWSNPDNWVSQVSLWASWKGLVEYLLHNLPKVMLYFFFPKSYGVDYTSAEYKRADGTLDWDKIYAQNGVRRRLYEAQKEFCEYYEIPYLDMQQQSVLNVGNIETFMNVGNVHPKMDAYHRWAEVTNRMLN